MRSLKTGIPAVILATGFLICTATMKGTPDYAKKEKKTCTICHAKMSTDKAEMLKNLNTTGTCYKDNGHSLAKCDSAKK